MSSKEISLNGELRQVVSDTIADLLEEMELGSKKVAVELNKEIVTRSSYGATALAAGDTVEIVHFVGGG